MKKIYVFIVFICFSFISYAQVPTEINEINYQGIAREADGIPLANALIAVKITLFNINGVSIYSETHSSISTNKFGLFTLLIGSVNPIPSTKWNEATQIKTEADFGSGFEDIGTVNLTAVPYAFKAKYEGQKISYSNNTLYITDGNGTNIDSVSINYGGTGADNWGTDSVNTSGTNISGNGTITNPLIVTEVDGSITNELQDLSLISNTLGLTNSTSTIDLSSYLDNTDAQTLSLTGQTLTIFGGNNITLPTDSDNQNINGLALNTTTNILTVGIQNGTSQTVDLTSLAGDKDWNEVGGTTAPDNINDNIFTQGKVGIGTINPSMKLEVKDNSSNFATKISQNNALGNGLSIENIVSGNGANNTVLRAEGDSNLGLKLQGNGKLLIGNISGLPSTTLHVKHSSGSGVYATTIENTTSNAHGLNIIAPNSVASSGKLLNIENSLGSIFIVKANGNVGIGITSPTETLEINRNSNASLKITSNVGNAKIKLQSNTGNSTLNFYESGSLQSETGWNNSSNYYYIYENGATSLVAKNQKIGIGTITPTERLEVNGTIKIDDSADPNELNRSSTGNANLVPIAYANISASGSINVSSNNVTINKTGPGQYRIKVSGETLTVSNCIVSINTQNSNPRFVGYGSLGGDIYVYIRNISSAFIDNSFSISIFKP